VWFFVYVRVIFHHKAVGWREGRRAMVALVAALVALATYGGCPGDRQDVYPDCNTIPSLLSLCHGPTANQVCELIHFIQARAMCRTAHANKCVPACLPSLPVTPQRLARLCNAVTHAHV
jgi:hypothetical protein